jgi:MoaA/NifB/PqqE/SkfB family radical SAM enzyme
MKGTRKFGLSEGSRMFFLNFYHFVFTNTKMIMALNVTNRCNLKCTHCYWWREEHPAELDDEAMIALMQKQRKAGKSMALLYGGEPTLRPNIIRAASELFDCVFVFTNGTVGFPDIPVVWSLSLDGTREIHDAIRGKGVYDKVMKNIERDTFRKPTQP